jgi:hypothetical protein
MLRLELDVSNGTTIEEAYSEAISVSKKLGIRVRFDFNEVMLYCDQDTNLDEVVADYYKYCEMKRKKNENNKL